MKQNILIVEDDTSFGTLLQNWFKKNGFETSWCSRIEQAKRAIEKQSFGLIISDLRLPDGDGIMLLTWIKEIRPTSQVIIMTSYGEIQSAVSSMKLGAFDYLTKPINPQLLKQKVEQALATPVTAEVRQKKETKLSSEGVVYGKSKAAQLMYGHILKVAPTRISVLITGESGSGKEYVARMIHDNSKRKDNLFIAVDCGSLSRELAPSELFGHLKGSFTSAVADKKGVFEQAQGGTVFLDEIGNLPYDVQVQLLRALQELKVRPVGSAIDIEVDVRIIAATNEDLEHAISEGKFREDLYHRLNELSIQIPPLRDRESDILHFATHFLNNANKELDKTVSGFTEETIAVLKKYHWPGNLRELRNTIRRAVLFTEGDEITLSDLPPTLSTTFSEEDLPLRPENEQQQIEKALIRAQGNKTLAAKLLKIDRKTLYNKMHSYGMEI